VEEIAVGNQTITLFSTKHGSKFMLLNEGTILLADDDGDYAVLLQEALHEAHIDNPVELVTDGLQTIDYLKGEGRYSDRAAHPLPELVILDLKLPVRHGFEVLRWIRRQPGLNDTYVAIFSGSGFENEARVARELGADEFVVKPHEFRQLVGRLEELRDACSHKTHAAEAIEKP